MTAGTFVHFCHRYHTPYGEASEAQITIDGENDFGYTSLPAAIFAAAEAGFYANYNSQSMKASFLIAAGWFLFMFYTQVVLLNLLIAIMTETHSRVHEVARLVAIFERAKLLVEFEAGLGFDYYEDVRTAGTRRALHRRAARRALEP
jgi:hypothetical protein